MLARQALWAQRREWLAGRTTSRNWNWNGPGLATPRLVLLVLLPSRATRAERSGLLFSTELVSELQMDIE
jgi:hypothetical protein